jgi:hypothetical protein
MDAGPVKRRVVGFDVSDKFIDPSGGDEINDSDENEPLHPQ